MTKPTNNEGSKWNTRWLLASVFALLVLTIGILARSASTGANWVVEDVHKNTENIDDNTEGIADNKLGITENRVNVQNTMVILNEMKTDIKDIKRFVIGK